MALSLGLDAPQQAQLEEVLKEHLSALSEIREMRKTSNGTEASESSPTKFERLNERLDRQIAFQEELKGILTDSQFDQWRAHVERKKPRRKHRHR